MATLDRRYAISPVSFSRTQLSILAESMGMRVRFYDIALVMPLGNSKRLDTMDQLLSTSDFVTLHVPLTPQTVNMIGAREIGLMKKGSFLLNASRYFHRCDVLCVSLKVIFLTHFRGTVVDLDALAEALKSGALAGAYVDVYPEEPASNSEPFSSPLQGCPNTILTPHIGGSTIEAQVTIAEEVASK
jgi:D-3-phosphoglycerate dehydrogenase